VKCSDVLSGHELYVVVGYPFSLYIGLLSSPRSEFRRLRRRYNGSCAILGVAVA
jgi:hypothetical protein